MKFYLASRYSRRLELCDYRSELEKRGFTVTSQWLNGAHQISNEGVPIGDTGEALMESGDCTQAALLRQSFAEEDVADVLDADLLIHFTEPPRASASRGGRHVEMGIAIGLEKPIWIVGHRENIFCWLSPRHNVWFFESWADVVNHLNTAFTR